MFAYHFPNAMEAADRQTLGLQTANEVTQPLAIFGEAALELSEFGIAVRSDTALIRSTHIVWLGPPIALVAGSDAWHFQ